MDEFGIIESIITDKATIAKKNNYTYIERLFPEFQDDSGIILLSKKKSLSPTNVEDQKFPFQYNESLNTSEHEVTGSPLAHSFGDDNFNITIVSEKRNWSKDEENDIPIEKLQASTMLILCLEHLSNKWTKPLFALCDCSDIEKTVLLGAFVEPLWFTTIKVCLGGVVGLSKSHNCTPLMQEHLEISMVPKHEVKVTVCSTYEYSGIDKTTVDWSGTKRYHFEGYLSLELSWNTLSFLPPVRPTSNYLVAEIAAGWCGSPLNDLWNQLMLLDKYLTILESYQKKNLSSRYSVLPLKFPHDFSSPCLKNSENLMEKLKLLLSGDDAFDDPSEILGEIILREDNPFLRNYIKELPTRENLDFSDQLWQLVICSNDYAEMTDCIHAVFEEVVDKQYKPQINETNPTRIGTLISEINSQKTVVPSLAGSLPLELVIDMGVEKLCRDYTYLLLSANLAEMYDMRQKLVKVATEDFNATKYRKKLMTMAQIHICMDFLLLLQNHLKCTPDTSYSFFDHAMKLYTSEKSPLKSFEELVQNTIYTLKVPGSNSLLEEAVKASPSSWKATLSSSRKASKFTTTTYYSRIPIFPPNIYTPEDPIEGEESFYVTKAVKDSYKIK